MFAPWIASAKARTCWSLIPTSALTAPFASLSARPTLFLLKRTPPADQLHFIKLNADLAFAKGWTSITKRKAAMPDADEWNGKDGKLAMLER